MASKKKAPPFKSKGAKSKGKGAEMKEEMKEKGKGCH